MKKLYIFWLINLINLSFLYSSNEEKITKRDALTAKNNVHDRYINNHKSAIEDYNKLIIEGRSSDNFTGVNALVDAKIAEQKFLYPSWIGQLLATVIKINFCKHQISSSGNEIKDILLNPYDSETMAIYFSSDKFPTLSKYDNLKKYQNMKGAIIINRLNTTKKLSENEWLQEVEKETKQDFNEDEKIKLLKYTYSIYRDRSLLSFDYATSNRLPWKNYYENLFKNMGNETRTAQIARLKKDNIIDTNSKIAKLFDRIANNK